MTTPIDYGPIRDGEMPAVARAVSLAFGSPPDKCEEWLKSAGAENLRVLRSAGRPTATLLRILMGQFFGGRSVPMTGIAGVAVSPEDRGKGIALAMMQQCIREIAADGTPLSGLYASTSALYRQVGYEQAGHLNRVRIPIASLSAPPRGIDIRELTAADEPAVRACYTQFARRFEGTLDRGDYSWNRVRRWRDADYTGFGIFAPGGALAGYLYLTQSRLDSGKHDVVLSDIVFTSAVAGQALLGFLANFATMGEDVLVPQIGPAHPMLTLLPNQRFTIERREFWMTRIADLAKALEARGYPLGVTASVTLEVRDDLVPANDGTFTVAIEGGRAKVTRAGSGPALRASIGGLAPLYTGFYSARQAVLAGLVEGDEQVLEAACTIFPGACPWMADFF